LIDIFLILLRLNFAIHESRKLKQARLPDQYVDLLRRIICSYKSRRLLLPHGVLQTK